MQARLKFHGAAREVTGSMHLIEANGYKLALDCGLNQGRRAEANEKNRTFPCRPQELNAVILSHAHIDHCGKLPRLVREGFQGQVYVTSPTRDLVKILLADSAHIQQEDANYWNKKRVKKGDAPIEPLYTQEDVDATARLLQARPLHEPFNIAPGIRVTFHEAGHLLGSASVNVEIDEVNGGPVAITYSGDLGRPGMAILRDPSPLPPCDYLLCESTYGGRETESPQGISDKLVQIVNSTVERGGKMIIPAFAVGRTQVMVYHFHRLMRQGRIREDLPIFVDSPLAVRATDIFRKHPEVFDREATDLNNATAATGGMLACNGCTYVQSVEESKALHHRKEPMIIISASGMCETGRILHHLKNNIGDPNNTILIVGYQASHTLGRRLVEHQKRVRIFGEMYEVKARVKVFNGFSAHANAEQLADMTAPLADRVRQAFLVHGEPDQSEELAATMRGRGFREVLVPEPGQTFELH
ncbi:MAG: MBL fold metallo-hydrolase [Phycisphaerae bacterium]|nr:MBL fold metallo-hydrolase [Phycisphaerae bacterium]